MLTVGQLLKKTRQRFKKNLSQIAKETKIPETTLRALEMDNFSHIPKGPFVKGFIRNYAQAINLDPEKAIAIFRRDFTITEKGSILPKGLAEPLDEPPSWKRHLFIIGVVVALGTLFLGYAGLQLKNYFAPPKLAITQPQEGIVLKGPMIQVKGWVSADSSVWVNDELAEVFPNGEFRINISLLSGENTLIVKAENRRKKTTEKRLKVEVGK